MIKTIEIAVSTTTEAAEIIADILSEFSYGGVSIKDSGDILTLFKNGQTWDYIDESLIKAAEEGGGATVSGFAEKSKARAIATDLEARFAALKREIEEIDFGSLTVNLRPVDDNAWHKTWKKNFKPITIGNIVICPKWIKYAPKENENVVLLNSGMAFGTGEHETTSMCIELMQKFDFAGKTVLDIGCGSGILGITAARLGAEKCFLSDIDSMAIAASTQNVKLNKVARVASVENKNLLDGVSVKADFILANLTAGLLCELCDGIKSAAKSDCVVITSGIINTKVDDVISRYTAEGFTLCEKQTKNDWCALAFKAGK